MQASMWSSSLTQQNYLELLPCSLARFSHSKSIDLCFVVTSSDPIQGRFSSVVPGSPRQDRRICFCNASLPHPVHRAATIGSVFVGWCYDDTVKSGHKQAVFAMDEEPSGMTEEAASQKKEWERVTHDFPSESTHKLDMSEVVGTPGTAIKGTHVTEAQSGLARALCNAGLSETDSAFIASKAPVTVRLLINTALELDEFATWIAYPPSTHQDVEHRICELAISNPSKQFAALIESVGVNERKISRVCHYLASQDISDVLQKIRILEDVFPNEKVEAIAIRTRRIMREMSLSADGALQKTLSFFEKMEAKRGGTSMLNLPRKAMPHVIEEFPEILIRDLESDLKALVDYFEEIGVPKDNVTSVVMCFPSILLYRSVEELQIRLRTLKKEASVRPRNFGKMVVKYPWILSRCVESNVKPMSDFLISIKIPPGKVGHCITKCPNLLGSSTTSLQIMVQHLILTGVKRGTLGNILVHYPQLLLKTPRSFDEIITFLNGWGLEGNDILKLLMRCPPIFASTVTHLRMKITLLQQLGIRNERLKRVLRKYPEYLLLSLENVKPRLSFLKSIGLTNEDIAYMISGFPPLLSYSIDRVLRPKLDVLENVLRHPIKEVVTYPRYFSYCVDKKILPRFRIMKRVSVEWDLRSMLSPSDDQFAHDFLGVGRMLVPPV